MGSKGLPSPRCRLGLKDEQYDVGERGYICERWLASVTKADNAKGPLDEGLSKVKVGESESITLKEAIELLPDLFLGAEYSRTHKGLGRLVKIYDFGARIHFHLHQMEKDARLVGRNSKDEAYHYLEGVDMGDHPETFFGVHPSIVERRQFEILLPYLQAWNSDLILKHSRAYMNVPGEGFFLPSGILHAPGTALTLELQEDSDVGAFFQALNAGKVISKDMLHKDVSEKEWQKSKERALLEQVDWTANGDPYFYENHHLSPVPVTGSYGEFAREYWVFYGTRKFSGKKLEIDPDASLTFSEKGVYSIFTWRGSADISGNKVEAGNFECDELFVCHERAIQPLTIRNTGKERLVLFKFFGPDVNDDAPVLPRYPKSRSTYGRSGYRSDKLERSNSKRRLTLAVIALLLSISDSPMPTQ